MKKIFTYILSIFTLAVNGQSIELQLNPEKSCNDRTYCVDIQLKKSSLSASDATIGTSSILLTYDEEVLVFKNYTSKSFDENSPCNGWLPHRYDAISRQGEIEITMVLTQNGNACPVIGNNAIDVGQVCFDIIQQGASPNIRYDLDHSQFNKNDVNDGSEIVAIANAAFIDEKNLLVCDCTGTGEPCDDGNIYTLNDRYDVYCNCLGQYQDVDQDGIFDGIDPCLDQKYEAEDAELNEVAVKNNQPQFCGLGFVDYLHNNGDFIEFIVNANQEGLHTLAFRYALDEGNRWLELTIDGDVVVPELDFPATGTWSNWGMVVLEHHLTVGTHAIRISTNGSHGPNLDQLVVSICSGCAETGQPCDDGNECTTDDVIGLDCNCGGKYEDTDFDGICNVLDICEGYDDGKDTDGDEIPDGCDVCDNALIGTPCDDGDPCTENDKYIADCECLGTFAGNDSDGDGICDSYDICPDGNDALDADGDGTPDACDTCDDRLIGTPCDDGDPCTLLDVVRPDCSCLGIFFDSDDDGICTELDLCEGFDDTIDNDNDGQPDACDEGIAISQIMEIGKAHGVTDNWRTIELQQNYQSMVVVATVVMPNNGALPVVTRIRNAAGNKFELRVQNPSGETVDPYDVQFVVAEEGIYTEEQHGIKMEVRKELSVETASVDGGYFREERDYLQVYSRPVVIGQVMTANDDSWSVFWSSRHNSGGTPADSVGFAAGKMVAEDSIFARLDETIGFFVIESGNYSRNGVRLEVRLGENTVEGISGTASGFAYQLDLQKANHAVLSTSGLNGGNGGWPVLFGEQQFRDNSMFLAFDEDQIFDSERYHVTEEISYIAFEFVQPLAIASTETTDVSCYDGENGSAAVEATGGEAPYSFAWSNGETTTTIDGLSAGSYTVTVTDANGTELTAIATVSQPPAIDWSLQGGAITCIGENDGYASVISFGGTGQHAYIWTNGSNENTIDNLSAGNYSVYITDENGCLVSDTYTVVEPAELVVENEGTDVLCFGENSGSVSTASTGGTGQISFLWNTGATTQNLSNVPAGEYTLTVTDGNGCQTTSSIVIEQPTELEANVSTTFTSCNGGSDGTATVSYSGGSGMKTVLWSNGEATETIDGLTNGNYSVTVTDENGCISVAEANVTDPAMLGVNVSAINASCVGVGNGVASAIHSGGTGDVGYLWSTGATTPTISNLLAGEYIVTVTDENGCEAVSFVEIINTGALEVQAAVADVNCSGGSDGIVDLTPYGATSPYVFIWSNGSTESSIWQVPAGEYTVTVNSSEGCELIDTFIISEPEELVIETDYTNVACFGGMDGTASVFASGGTGDLSFLWNTTETEPEIVNLPAGEYTILVTDVNSCEQLETIIIEEPNEIQITVDSVMAAIGTNSDGAIEISVDGGTPFYAYEWSLNGVFVSDEEDPANLQAGEYTLVLTDANGCETTTTVIVESVTSAEERNLLQHIRLTPNPTTGLFSLFLDLPNHHNITASILDVSGKMILTEVQVNSRYDFDLTNEAAGVYLLRIKVGKLEVAKRVVVVD